MRDYFISYAKENRDAATDLLQALEGLDAKCFIDYRDIPSGHPRYRERLIEGISECECIVVLLSQYSQASDEVDREVQAAHDRGHRRIGLWLDQRQQYTNGTLEMLLSSSQDLVWTDEPAHDVAQRIRATATVSSLRNQLADYQSVVDRLNVDLSTVFDRVEAHDFTGAVGLVAQIAVEILRQLWHLYRVPGPLSEEMRDLIIGCRDHFEHQSLLASFGAIEDTARRSVLRPSSMDATIKAIEHLMTVLSVLRTQRWGLRALTPRLRADAAFLSGLMLEAGWLQGSELVPSTDVVYMVFERAGRDTKRYMEILLGEHEEAITQISQQSDGRIFPATETPVMTRFLVLAGDEPADNARTGKFLTPDEFVVRFTGVSALPDLTATGEGRDALTREVTSHLVGGRSNVLVYGAPGVGKSHTLGSLAASGWPGSPQIRFLVDYASADLMTAEQALDTQLASRFPVEVRPRTRELVGFLVRTGRAALLLDSIECATTLDDPIQVARTFARLCTFLSKDSTVVMAGRDAALRDSATVREFLMNEPAVSDVLSHTLRSTGVDSARLPSLQMVRAKKRHRWQVSTARDRVIDVVTRDIWDADDHVAAAALAAVVPTDRLSATGLESLTREQIVSLALGGIPSTLADSLELADLNLTNVATERPLRELRAAIDYVRTALLAGPVERWDGVAVGETTRRLVRLISASSYSDGAAPESVLALVGPPNCVVAVPKLDTSKISPTTVSAGQYREFLRALPTLSSLDGLSSGLPDESQLHPMYERIPHDLFRDDALSDYPAVGVSWWAADSFAKWSGGRLPTSLEWEVAARGWDGRIFPWGDRPHTGPINCADRSAGKPIVDYAMWRDAMRRNDIKPRASYPSNPATKNRSPSAALDMVGNVWEWLATSVSDQHYVIAGGSYDNPLRACVASSRSVAAPSTRSNAVGFRVMAL